MAMCWYPQQAAIVTANTVITNVQGAATNTPNKKSHYFWISWCFWWIFQRLFVRYFAITAANFSISTLVLQKQHSFKHKRHFLKCTNTKIRSKPFYTQILCYDTYCNIAERNLSHLQQIFSLIITENCVQNY